MLIDTGIILLINFLFCCLISCWLLWPYLKKALDQAIAEIQLQLINTADAHTQAESYYQSIKEQFSNTNDQVKLLKQRAHEDFTTLHQEAQQNLTALLLAKQHNHEARLREIYRSKLEAIQWMVYAEALTLLRKEITHRSAQDRRIFNDHQLSQLHQEKNL